MPTLNAERYSHPVTPRTQASVFIHAGVIVKPWNDVNESMTSARIASSRRGWRTVTRSLPQGRRFKATLSLRQLFMHSVQTVQ